MHFLLNALCIASNFSQHPLLAPSPSHPYRCYWLDDIHTQYTYHISLQIFQQGDDEASARACKIAITNNVVEHVSTLWRETLMSGNADIDTINTVSLYAAAHWTGL